MDKDELVNKQRGDIYLTDLIRKIAAKSKLLVRFILFFTLLGLFIAFTVADQYKAEARLLPEVRDIGGGASQLLRQFGGLGGLSLPIGEGADAISPELYPAVIISTPFFTELLKTEILVGSIKGAKKMTVFEYMDDHILTFWGLFWKYTIKLPYTIADWLRGEKDYEGLQETGLPKLSKKEYEAAVSLSKRINASIGLRSGVITISAEFPDPLIAAQIAEFAVNYLSAYIIEYRIEKAMIDLIFIKERYNEKKDEFFKSQFDLARFNDENMNIISARARTEQQRLESQYELAFNIYNGLAQQLEQAKITVQEETPVIKVLDPVYVPVKKTRYSKTLILAVSIFFGTLIAITYILGKDYIFYYISLIKEVRKSNF